MKVTVTQGQIVIRRIWLAVDHPDCKVLEADCITKNGEVHGLSTTWEGGRDVVLGAGEHTLYAAQTDDLTLVRVEELDGSGQEWAHEAFFGRYTLRILLWRFGDAERWQEIYSRPEP